MAEQRCVKKCSGSIAAMMLIVIALLIWLFVTVGSIGSVIICLVDKLTEIFDSIVGAKDVPDEVKDAVSTLRESAPPEDLALVRQLGTLLPAFAISPAVLVIVFMFTGLACTFRQEGNGYYCAKCFFFFTSLFLLLGVAFYVVLGIIGFLVDTPDVQVIEQQVEATCNEFIPALSEATDAAAEELKDQRKEYENAYGDNMPQDAKEDLDALEAALAITQVTFDHFGEVCDCIETFFPSVRTLVGPGFGCGVLFLITFIMTQVQCCYMGCCCRNPEKDGDVKMTNLNAA